MFGPEALTLAPYAGQLGVGGAVLVLMVPVLWLCTWLWHRAKAHWPHECHLGLAFVWEFCSRPW